MLDNNLLDYVLMQADDRLILSHRLSEECGHGPFLEEDIANSNISLDLLGQANEFYEYAAEISNDGRTADSFAFLRSDTKFKNLLICEIANGDFAHIMVRQYFFDLYDFNYYNSLKNSKNEKLVAIAEKSIKECAYHLRHSRKWLNVLADGTAESRERLITAINDIWAYTGEMFESNDAIKTLVQQGIAVNLDKLKEIWTSEVQKDFKKLNLDIPESTWMHSGGRSGRHSERLGEILTSLQYLQRAYPNAEW